MTTKNTVVKDHTVENFQDDLINFMIHSEIAKNMAYILTQSRFKSEGSKIIKSLARGIFDKLMSVRKVIEALEPHNDAEEFILKKVSTGPDKNGLEPVLNPYGDKFNNIANITQMIAFSKKDYTDKIDFVFSKSRRKEMMKNCWLAAGGNEAGFELYYNEENELTYSKK